MSEESDIAHQQPYEEGDEDKAALNDLSPLERAWLEYEDLDAQLREQLDRSGTVSVQTLRDASDAYQNYLMGGEQQETDWLGRVLGVFLQRREEVQ